MNKQLATPLFDALKAYDERKVIPFDVPGHKHGKGLEKMREYYGDKMFELDVNSMPCLDNLSNPIGVIKEAEALAAEAFGADRAYFLVNGTSAGIQAMIMSVCEPGDKVILPRNCHKSATSALILSGAIPIYVQPQIDEQLGIAMSVELEDIKQTIADNPEAAAVFIINPTYYGAASDLKEIIRFAHQYNMMVLVDEAHGAHFHFHPDVPQSAMKLGADMSAVSLHKTGGSLTQSSILLLNEERIAHSKVKTTLSLTQTTSASYLLMASLDIARAQLATEGEERISNILKLCEEARVRIEGIEGLYAFGPDQIGHPGVFAFDTTKLGVNVAQLGLTGFEVYDMLFEHYNIQIEMADMYNILAIVSLGDTKESLSALVDALEDIALNRRKSEPVILYTATLTNPQVIVSPRDAYYATKHVVALEDAVGEISGESIMTYPPGIPIVTPGEKISAQMVEHIVRLKSQPSLMQGTEDPYVDFIKVLGY
ncbi:MULTISPECIES: aminotransferase class I/II-fold pyridoxal phosphate-dependent enzyme [unclassified Fusibacter]|uniref:aminotransferase class I/II-fold pyridoxal phosphate-dependent enzyme n=1 Tax=unclassified Fusibacter TaxID=2624464 RepID=UPI00101381F9|nr:MULTISPECIES: aminotransferase class I/II-fold pyridoxal phosphate-dependent enzyme [unclassified Fusibacter]MCK8059259.1 aminotransferase class I/II-fold pyridoxal phosphate-dependent enzyme [Fusibacter sp. A2]NPE21277.1 aminotransferase class I/II-fold pyridoxal phosphate-dependent enzyme [Fusibacter sp. A1]RXV62542.1 aminotransferase class V-fold PLP-dependent enzyme [Fusibacter sp. A1]